MAIKKYTSGAWVSTSYRKYGTETDTLTSLPAQIIGDGQPITSCQISGNTVQNGTPTPEAPVDVQGVGDIWNHWNGTHVCYHLGKVIGENKVSRVGNGAMFQFEATPNVDYTVEQDSPPATSLLRIYRSNNPLVEAEGVSIAYDSMMEWNGTGTPKATINSGSFKYIWIQFGGSWYDSYGASATISLVGDYVIPLAVNSTEYPIYLGQVPTTRRIKKLVLTGEENVDLNNVDRNRLIIQVLYSLPRTGTTTATNIICSHLKTLSTAEATAAEQGITMRSNGTDILFGIPFSLIGATTEDSSSTIRAKVKSYLAAQYAAGTPVTVWYVLATTETGIVNEPLMKIGDYADTVSATNIPTTGTAEQFDIQTTLKPSEVQLTYHGWHEHDDTKYTQGE